MPIPRQTFREHERIRRDADFQRLRRAGRKRVGRWLVMWLFRRDELPPRAARFGVTVGRKSGNAARRNLFKRRMREIFRLNKEHLARGWDLLAAPKLGATAPDAFPPELTELRADFLRLIEPVRTESQ